MNTDDPSITVCIATCKRPQKLALLLSDLANQSLRPVEVVVVDNDARGSAAAVVEAARAARAPFPIIYEVQPIKNISLTRNRTVALAQSEWLAFVDDDERAPRDWLNVLMGEALRSRADVVLAPVVPQLPPGAPGWIGRGRFYDWARMPTGTEVPLNKLRFGNVLSRKAPLTALAGPFDPRLGLTGGEDGDLLARMVEAGSRVVWCDEAAVTEPVDPSRLSLRWLMLRALRGGQDFARHSLAGRYGSMSLAGRLVLFGRASLQLLVSMTLAVLSWPLGSHRSALWLTKASANLGKLSVLWGWHHREYA
jgi:succinoglycan biosynthesis protein ExoM